MDVIDAPPRQTESEAPVQNASQTPPVLENAPVPEPTRTEPVKLLEPRKRRLDRQVEERIPEVHIVGRLSTAREVCLDVTEGIFIRYTPQFVRGYFF